MSKTTRERVAEYRTRRKQGVEVPQCKCTRPLKGSLSKKRQLCKSCYDSSPDKRHKTWLVNNAKRGRATWLEVLQEWGEYRVNSEVKARDGNVGIIQSIASYIDGSVSANVVFNDGDNDVFLLSCELPLISIDIM